MTKRYDIIYLSDGYMYGIDKEDSGKSNDTIIDIVGRLWVNMEECFHKAALNQGCWKVHFTNNPSLGLPLLPDIEKNLKQELYNIIAGDWARHEDDYPYIKQTVEQCYKAASAKNKYTGEDMRNAHMTGSIAALNWSKAGIEEEFNHLTRAEDYIQSLSPKLPIAVEVEMEIDSDNAWNYNPERGENWHYKLQLNGNQVIVKQWIYEE